MIEPSNINENYYFDFFMVNDAGNHWNYYASEHIPLIEVCARQERNYRYKASESELESECKSDSKSKSRP